MAPPGDGLAALQKVLDLGQIMQAIERTALWVSPDTFRLLPVWYPEHARRAYVYKGDWSEPLRTRSRGSGHDERTREGNVYANRALTAALGLTARQRPNWSCCHIWSADARWAGAGNAVAQDRRYFTCLANMVLLPTPLKAFTDAMPEVRGMLRAGARRLYGWVCEPPDTAAEAERLDDWEAAVAYPRSWAGGDFPGVRDLTPDIRAAADRRLDALRRDLAQAGPYYPREEVRSALAYWRLDLDGQTSSNVPLTRGA